MECDDDRSNSKLYSILPSRGDNPPNTEGFFSTSLPEDCQRNPYQGHLPRRPRQSSLSECSVSTIHVAKHRHHRSCSLSESTVASQSTTNISTAIHGASFSNTAGQRANNYMSNNNNREAVLDGANHSESIECDAIPPHTIKSEDLMAMDSVTSHQDELLTHSQVATTNDDATVTSTVSASIMRDNDRQNAITTTTTTAAAAAAAVPPPPLSIRTGRDLAILNSSIAPSQVMPAPLAPVPSSPQSIAWNLARRKRRATSSSPGPQPHRRLRLRSPPMSHPYQNYNSPCGSPTTVTAHRFGGNTTGAAGESLGTALSPSSLFGTSASPFASPTALSMAGSISSNGGNGIPSKAFLSGRDLALPRRGRQRAGSLTLLYGAAHAATIVAQAARRSRGHASTQEDSLLMGERSVILGSNQHSSLSSGELSHSSLSSSSQSPMTSSNDHEGTRSSTSQSGSRLTSPAVPGRKLSVAYAEGKLRPRLLHRVQSMLESESRPMEQEVERECELQMQLREFEDTLNPDSDEITPGMNVRLPWLNSSNNSNSNNNDVVENITSSSAPTYFRSKLNPEWDFFRGDPSPSPSSSCMSSPGLYPMPPGSATPFWSSGHPGANASSGGAGGPRRSSKRKASCDRMDPYTSALYKRRAGSPVMLPSSPRVLAGQHHHHQHHQYQQHGSTAWTAGLPSNVNAMISTSLPSPLSISASQSAPISGFSLGPPLQPLYSPSDIRSLSRRNSIINIQETNVTFGKMSLDDDDDNDDGHTDDNNSKTTSSSGTTDTSKRDAHH